MASFNSLDARKATFLLAPILIASPVAGLRPMRAGRFLTCKYAEPRNSDSFALLQMLGDQTDEVVQEFASRAFRQLVFFGQAAASWVSEIVTLSAMLSPWMRA